MNTIQNIKNRFNAPEMYDVFSLCMYMPSWEKFSSRADEYMADGNINIFGYYEDNCVIGIIAVGKTSNEEFEVKGIAVKQGHRNRGTGKKLIRYVCGELSISILSAETDDDAVGFYKSCGFVCREFNRTGENGEYKRYSCVYYTKSTLPRFIL